MNTLALTQFTAYKNLNAYLKFQYHNITSTVPTIQYHCTVWYLVNWLCKTLIVKIDFQFAQISAYPMLLKFVKLLSYSNCDRLHLTLVKVNGKLSQWFSPTCYTYPRVYYYCLCMCQYCFLYSSNLYYSKFHKVGMISQCFGQISVN